MQNVELSTCAPLVAVTYKLYEKAKGVGRYKEFREHIVCEECTDVAKSDLSSCEPEDQRALLATLTMRELEVLLSSGSDIAWDFFMRAPIFFKKSDEITGVPAWETLSDWINAGLPLSQFTACSGIECIQKFAIGLFRKKIFGKNDHDIEDFVEEVVLKVLTSIPKYKRKITKGTYTIEYSFLSFVYVIIGTKIKDFLRDNLKNQKPLDALKENLKGNDPSYREPCQEQNGDFGENLAEDTQGQKEFIGDIFDEENDSDDVKRERDAIEEEIAGERRKLTLLKLTSIPDEYRISRKYIIELDNLFQINDYGIAMPLFMFFLISVMGYAPAALYKRGYPNSVFDHAFETILLDSFQLLRVFAKNPESRIQLPGKFGVLLYIQKIAEIAWGSRGKNLSAKNCRYFLGAFRVLLRAVFEAGKRHAKRLSGMCQFCCQFMEADNRMSCAALNCKSCKNCKDAKNAHKTAINNEESGHHRPQGCLMILKDDVITKQSMLGCRFSLCRLQVRRFGKILEILTHYFGQEEIQSKIKEVMAAQRQGVNNHDR
jgi:DNA-directed RNA polymerase specialized sigma24 family protein